MPLRLYASSSSSSLLTLLLLAQVFVAVVVEAGNYSLDVSFPAANQQPFVELPIFAFGETGVTEVRLSDSASPVVVVFVLEKTTSVLTQRVHANIDTQRRLCDVGVGGSSKTNGWRRDLSAVRSPRLSRDNATSASLVVKGAPGFYALTMYRCPGSGEPATTVIPVDVSQYNVHTSSDGIRSVSFASYGDEYVAELYLLMFVLCSIACLVWLRQLRLAAARVAAIHNVMSIVIVVTTVSMQLQWVRLNYIKHDGRDTSVFFEFVCTLMRAVAAVLMFSCVVLLGSGWSIGTPTLRQRERRILVVSAVLQGIVQVATLWSHIPHAVDLTLKAADLVSCILTTVPVAYTVQTLVSSMPYIDVFDDDEEPDEYNKAHGARLREDAARIQRRLTQYRWFHAAIIAYYYATRCVIPLLEGYLDYSMTWVCQALSLLGTFSLYVYCGAKFRPVEVEDVDLTNNNKTPSFGATAMDAVV